MSGTRGPCRGPSATIDLEGKDTAAPAEPCPKCGRPSWSGHQAIWHDDPPLPPVFEEIDGRVFVRLELGELFDLVDDLKVGIMARARASVTP